MILMIDYFNSRF